jgi:hypothetical protein
MIQKEARNMQIDLLTALYIMDEKGRHIYNDPTDKTTLNMSVGLWPKDWDRLRLALMDALFLLCDDSGSKS